MSKAVIASSGEESMYRDILSYTPEQIASRKEWGEYQVEQLVSLMVQTRKLQRLMPTLKANSSLMKAVQERAAKQMAESKAQSAALSSLARKPKPA